MFADAFTAEGALDSVTSVVADSKATEGESEFSMLCKGLMNRPFCDDSSMHTLRMRSSATSWKQSPKWLIYLRERREIYLVTVVLEELDRQGLLAIHQECKGVTTCCKICFIGKKLVDVVRNVTHETVAMKLVDRITMSHSPNRQERSENSILPNISGVMLQILFDVWNLQVR